MLHLISVCLLMLKQSSGTEIHHNLENSTWDPLKYTIGSPIVWYQYVWENPSKYKGITCRIPVVRMFLQVEWKTVQILISWLLRSQLIRIWTVFKTWYDIWAQHGKGLREKSDFKSKQITSTIVKYFILFWFSAHKLLYMKFQKIKIGVFSLSLC